jgi:hypothetical protein
VLGLEENAQVKRFAFSSEKQASTIKIVELKRFVRENFAPNSVLRDLILSERDEVSCDEFVVKVDVWLRLLRGDAKFP